MIAFIDDHREAHGVEPICKVLPIAPSTYHAHVAKRTDPAKLSTRAKQDLALTPEIARVFEENFDVYGVRKVWRQLQREGFDVARCTVERLMRGMGLQGVIRGKPVRTTISDKAAPCPLDHVNRQFQAPRPNALWVSDFTYVATWTGFVYVAFVIDAYARRIVGWRASRTAHASFVLDALEQALHDRRPVHRGGLVHHSDRGSQYVSIKYTERLAEAGIEPSVGSVGDSYDNALAETINGLYKAEVIHRRGPWRTFEAVEFATLEWVDWFNNRRLLEPIGNIPPAEAEERYYARVAETVHGLVRRQPRPSLGAPAAGALAPLRRVHGRRRDGARAGPRSFDAGDYRWVAEVANHLVFADPEKRGRPRAPGRRARAARLRRRERDLAELLPDGRAGAPRGNLGDADGGRARRLPRPPQRRAAPRRDGDPTQRAAGMGPGAADRLGRHRPRRGALDHGPQRGPPPPSRPPRSRPDAALIVERAALDELLLKTADLAALVESGRLRVEGDGAKLGELLGLLDEPDPGFAIVTPD